MKCKIANMQTKELWVNNLAKTLEEKYVYTETTFFRRRERRTRQFKLNYIIFGSLRKLCILL